MKTETKTLILVLVLSSFFVQCKKDEENIDIEKEKPSISILSESIVDGKFKGVANHDTLFVEIIGNAPEGVASLQVNLIYLHPEEKIVSTILDLDKNELDENQFELDFFYKLRYNDAYPGNTVTLEAILTDVNGAADTLIMTEIEAYYSMKEYKYITLDSDVVEGVQNYDFFLAAKVEGHGFNGPIQSVGPVSFSNAQSPSNQKDIHLVFDFDLSLSGGVAKEKSPFNVIGSYLCSPSSAENYNPLLVEDFEIKNTTELKLLLLSDIGIKNKLIIESLNEYKVLELMYLYENFSAKNNNPYRINIQGLDDYSFLIMFKTAEGRIGLMHNISFESHEGSASNINFDLWMMR